jgi:methyl-accepting chemotaxis protein
MKRRMKTVKVRLTVTVAAIVFFFAAVLIALTYGLMRDTAERNSAELADTVLEETDTHVTRFFRNMEEIARACAEHSAVYEIDLERFRELALTNVWARREYIRAIYLGTETGEMYEWGYGEGFVDNMPVFPEDYDPRVRPWYRHGIRVGDFAVTDPYLYASIEEYGITSVLPVYRPSGELVGVLGIDIMLEALQTLIAEFKISKGGRVYITDRRGEALVDQFGTVEGEGSGFVVPSSVEDLHDPEVSGRFVAHAAGVPHFFAYKQNRVTGWTIYVGLPVPAIMASTYSAIRMSIALNMILMILLLIALEWSGNQLVMEPISSMVDIIGKIRSGQGSARIDIHRDDEFGMLARSFNDLADRVEEYSREMEQKVRERTDRLQSLQHENLRLRVIEEKERIYGYLHDSLGSRLTNIVISNNVARSASGTDAAVLEDMHTRIDENAQAGLTDLKEILSGSMDLDRHIVDFRLVLELQVRRRLELKQIELTFHGRMDELNMLHPRAAGELEKTLQELTSNVLKHAEAQNVHVYVDSEEGAVTIRFSDDGRGFDLETVSPDSFGLKNIRNRIERLDGSFGVQSTPGSGTRVTIVLPLEADDDETH